MHAARWSRAHATRHGGRPGQAPGSGVPDHLVVGLLEARDQELDAGVVREDLARRREVATEHAAQDGIEEQHRVRTEGPVRPAGLEEVDGRPGQAAELDLPGDLLDELVTLFLGRLERAHEAPPIVSADRWSASLNAWEAAVPRRAKMTCSVPVLASSSSRTASTVICAASSSGKPPTPVPSAGKAMLVAPISRARAIALRTAASITAALVRRSRSSETAWMTTLAASDPAGVTMAPPSGTGAWRTASNSMASPPARLSAPPTPVDIHSDRLAAFTIASTSRSQMSPFQSSIRAKRLPLPLGESPQADRSRGGMVHPGQSAGHVGHHLPRVRVAQPRQLLDGDRGVAGSPDQDELVAKVDGRSGDVGDVGHDGIHGHVPDERHATAADERLGTVRQRARPAVAIAQRQGRDAARACRPERGTVADAGARRKLRDPDRACDE